MAAGLAIDFGPTLGVTTADFNGDGWIDIYQANDGQPNQLWINQHDGTFKNAALVAGAAIGADGQAKSSMGLDPRTCLVAGFRCDTARRHRSSPSGCVR